MLNSADEVNLARSLGWRVYTRITRPAAFIALGSLSVATDFAITAYRASCAARGPIHGLTDSFPLRSFVKFLVPLLFFSSCQAFGWTFSRARLVVRSKIRAQQCREVFIETLIVTAFCGI
jgi:hypothetical protein